MERGALQGLSKRFLYDSSYTHVAFFLFNHPLAFFGESILVHMA
jgi:hypothetical protein